MPVLTKEEMYAPTTATGPGHLSRINWYEWTVSSCRPFEYNAASRVAVSVRAVPRAAFLDTRAGVSA